MSKVIDFGLISTVKGPSRISEIYNIYKNEIGLSWNEDDFNAFAQNPKNAIEDIFYKDQLIGFIMYVVTTDDVDLLNIALVKEYQNSGIGSHVLNNLYLDFKENDIKSVFLETREGKTAQFYLKNGFKNDYTRKAYYSDGSDALVMSRHIV